MGYWENLREKEIHSVNGVFCPQAHKTKLQYETEDKALNAVKYGNGSIIRAYYCRECHCWHTTSKQEGPQEWEKMADTITKELDLDLGILEEEQNDMVFVKVVENNANGKVILPSYFPIGVYAKRFGYTENVFTNNLTKMTDISAYLILDEGKLVLKKLHDHDKEGFLRSFTARIEEQLDATNNYTMQHEIFPKDIFTEEELKHYPELVSEKAATSPEPLPEVDVEVEAPLSSDGLSPIDPDSVAELPEDEEIEDILAQYMNYYLEQLGLKQIDLDKNSYSLLLLAAKGEGLLSYAIAEYLPSLDALYAITDEHSLQLALGRLGFFEFLEVKERLCSYFFTAFYACAASQGNHDLRRHLEETLVGHEPKRIKSRSIIFK